MLRVRLLAAAVPLVASHALAQRTVTPIGDALVAGGETEGYLRALQTAGVVTRHQWSLRAFTPPEADALLPADTARHPWMARVARAEPGGRVSARLLRGEAGALYNSGFPWGMNDGAIWAGRGVTTWASAGAAARVGPLSITLAPLAFVTQNADFPIVDSGRPGRLRYEDPIRAGAVDYPQRFGDDAYGRLDWGETSARVDVAGLAAGVSNAHDWWGPAQYFPAVLGNNAPGFPHVFLGTNRPANLGVVRLHARWIVGRLGQTDYFQAEGLEAARNRPRRVAAAFAFVVQPRGFERLELGLTRFTHAPWPDSGLARRYFTRPFEGIFKKTLRVQENGIPTDSRSLDGENQLASVFARLAIPEGGFEVYGEFSREDHPWDTRYLALTPDEQSVLTVGFAKVWMSADRGRLTRLRGERINFQQAQVDQRRGYSPIYTHSAGSNQGHTQLGQVLGAGVGISTAAGGVLALDVFRPGGRWGVEWMRVVRRDRGSALADSVADPRAVDVVHALTVERRFFRGGSDLAIAGGAGYNFNRNFGDDRLNLTARLSVVGLPFAGGRRRQRAGAPAPSGGTQGDASRTALAETRAASGSTGSTGSATSARGASSPLSPRT
jgi:hypothetical protein